MGVFFIKNSACFYLSELLANGVDNVDSKCIIRADRTGISKKGKR